MTKTDKTKKTPATQPLATLLAAVGPHTATAWTEVMNAQTRFIMDRLQKDLEVQKAVLSCRDPNELLQIQSDFCREAMTQYAEQTARMLKLTTEATEQSMQAAKTGFSRAYDDVPL